MLEADHNAYNEVRGNIRENSSERVRSGLFEVCMSRKRRNDIYLLSSYSFFGNSFIDWMKGFEDPVINHSGFGRMYIFFFTHVHVE